jgi:hypothetical protein
VLDQLPQRLRAQASAPLRMLPVAETQAECERQRAQFARRYGKSYPNVNAGLKVPSSGGRFSPGDGRREAAQECRQRHRADLEGPPRGGNTVQETGRSSPVDRGGRGVRFIDLTTPRAVGNSFLLNNRVFPIFIALLTIAGAETVRHAMPSSSTLQTGMAELHSIQSWREQ